MIKQKALYIDVSTKGFELTDIEDEGILGPVDFGIREMEKDKGTITFGMGVLAHTNIPGTRRLIFCGYSPLWENFYISTLGGGSYVFKRLGINYVAIKGKSENTSVIKINQKGGKITVEFEEVDAESVWKEYNGKKGYYALQEYIFDKHHEDYKECRVLATGPAARYSLCGAIGSAPVQGGKITPVDCWAGRGGIGSKLIQENNIAGIIYGGDDFEPENKTLLDKAKIDQIFEEAMGKKMMMADMEATTKYRMDPRVGSGGTLGVNFTNLKGYMFSFNYSSIYFPDEERVELHKKFILDHYVKQFNEETIQKKQFKHCGEPCPAVCKKMNENYKKDYEPYQSLGPNAGIFDQRAAEKINHHVDAMGFDAIQIGSYVSWLMELLVKGIIKPEDYKLTKTPKWDWKEFDVVKDSMHNADLGIEIIDLILKDDFFQHGIRKAAKDLEAKGIKCINLAVFNSYKDNGCMIPNQYWTPGMFSPMPIMGKYFEYYGCELLRPLELGKRNAERMVMELYSDNTGICRFHRKWVEKLVPKLINELWGEDIDYHAHCKKLATRINQENESVFWESERVIDIIHGYLKKRQSETPDDEGLNEWVGKFDADKWGAAKEYWTNVLKGINEIL